MRSWKRCRQILSATAAGLLVAGPPAAAATTPAPPAPTSAAAILVDVDTGRVLYGENAHVPLPPGSLTKTLTAMIAADWLPPDAEIPVTADAYNASPDKVGMKPGQKWPLSITLHALITDSANDAAYALATDIGGSLQRFPAVMQLAGREIGLADHPVLYDPAGLDGSEGVHGGNRISAWDLAIMGRDMMANRDLAPIAAQRTFDFEGPDHIAYHIVSRNWHFLATFPGAIGVKTGYTDAAGFCDIEEAVKGNRHMLAVVLHSNNPDALSASLITKGFSTPASAETRDPVLPPVAEPSPHPPAPPTSTSTTSTTEPPKVAVTVTRPKRGSSYGWVDALAALGVVGGIGVWTRKWVKNRQRATPR